MTYTVKKPLQRDSQSKDLVNLGDERRIAEVVRASVHNLWEAVNNLTRLQLTNSLVLTGRLNWCVMIAGKEHAHDRTSHCVDIIAR